MSPSLVYATSGLAGGALGAIAGTAGFDRRYLWLLTPFVLSLATRRNLCVQAMGIAVLIGSLAWFVGGLHHDRAASLHRLAQRVPECDLSGWVQERFGNSGVVLGATLFCEGSSTAGGRAYARVDAAPGARVEGTGWLVPIGGDAGFDEMRTRAGLMTEFHPEEVRTSAPSGVFAIAEAVRSSLRAALADDPRGGLALGLTIGDTSRFSPSDTDALRASGLSHLVAVSGSNVAIVLGFIGALFVWTSRTTRLTMAIVGLVAFVLVVGPEPSVLRAAAMAAVALAALASGTRGDPLMGLVLAVTVLLIVRPALVWSVGLHLSAAATGGIVLWSRRVETLLSGVPSLIRSPLAVTLAAQAAVTPVLLASFGTISVVAPVSNILAVPAVAPATILALLSACLHPVAPPLAAAPAAAAEVLCGWILEVGRRLGSTGWAEMEIDPVWLLPATVVVAAVAVRVGRGD